MRFRPPLRVSVTRHEEKEQKLRDFIAQHIATATSLGRAACVPDSVVARSLESPVVKAIASLAREIAEAERVGAHDHGARRSRHLRRRLVRRGHVVGFDHEVRWARHPRLIEAHEQLVLGPQTCWIGDSMRRDPDQVRCLRELRRRLRRGGRLRAGVLRAAVDRLRAAAGARTPVHGGRDRRDCRRYASRGAGQARGRVGDDRRHAALILPKVRSRLRPALVPAVSFGRTPALGKKRKMSASPRNGGEQGEFRHCSVTGR